MLYVDMRTRGFKTWRALTPETWKLVPRSITGGSTDLVTSIKVIYLPFTVAMTETVTVG
jgi:hypothetical protein